MIGIMRKNAGFYLVYGVFFLAMSVLMWHSAFHSLRTPIAVINSFFIFFVSVVPALSAEAIEEKNRAYAFLMTLPVRLETIVKAKMALPLISLAAAVVFNLVLFRFFDSTPSVLAECDKIILLNASVSVVLAGGVYLFMYRYDVRTMMMVLVFLGVIFNLLGLIAARTRGAGNIFELPAMIVSGKPVWLFALLIPVSLGIYHLEYRRALKLKQERLFD